MTEFTDGEPLLDLPSIEPAQAASGTTSGDQPLDSLTREFQLSAMPWATRNDEPPAHDAPPRSRASDRRPPPAPSAKDGRASASILADAAEPRENDERPKRLITVPKPSPPVQSTSLPRVIVMHSMANADPDHRYMGETLPPRERSAEANVEQSAANARWFGTTRAMRPLLAVSVLAVGGLIVTAGLGLVRRRDADRIAVPAPPAFLAAASAVPTLPPSAGAIELGAPPPVASTSPARPVDAAPAPSAPPDAPDEAATESAAAPAPPPVPAPAPAPTADDAKVPTGAKLKSDSNPTVGKGSPSKVASARARVAAPPSSAVGDRPPPSRQASVGLANPAPVAPITTYTFAADELFPIATAPKRVTDLILQPGEKLVTRPTAGDASLWVIHVVDGVQRDQPQQHIQVTPLRAEASTNLTLTTTRRNYHLELTSSKGGAYMAAVQWRYPEDEAERRRAELSRLKRERDSVAQVSDVKALRFDYVIRATAGTPTWTPTTAFDDGARTFIRFPSPVPLTRAPLLFVLRSGGTKDAQYVNYRVRGDLYVIERLIDTAELRLPTSGNEHEIVRISRSAR
jgi:type IV secretion system protein TrbG